MPAVMNPITHSTRPRVERRAQNRVLAEKSGQRRNARNRDRRDHERPRRDRNLAPQRAHLAHVLLAGHRVDHAARTEEEQRLEERVGHQVENAGGERAHAQRQEHVAELADRGIGQHALDVVLHQAHASPRKSPSPRRRWPPRASATGAS